MKQKIRPFDSEEKALIRDVESGKSSPVSQKEYAAIVKAIRNQNAKVISIRVNQNDLDAFKQKASSAGIPYQTLMNSVLHRYVTGDVVLKTQI